MRTMSWILNVGTFEAVRRIPINTISLTGEVLGQEFESSLERDLIMLMAWHHDFEWFQVQPVKVSYTDQFGVVRKYTPDLLVHFHRRPGELGMDRKPILCEVKYRADLARNCSALKPKFRAARAYAREQGWEFRIYTEDRIRTPLFHNVQFLWPYRYRPQHEVHYDRLFRMLDDMEETSINGLLEACYHPQNSLGRGEGIWTLWCMIAKRTVICDLSVPLSMEARIWLAPALETEDSGDEDMDR